MPHGEQGHAALLLPGPSQLLVLSFPVERSSAGQAAGSIGCVLMAGKCRRTHSCQLCGWSAGTAKTADCPPGI